MIPAQNAAFKRATRSMASVGMNIAEAGAATQELKTAMARAFTPEFEAVVAALEADRKRARVRRTAVTLAAVWLLVLICAAVVWAVSS